MDEVVGISRVCVEKDVVWYETVSTRARKRTFCTEKTRKTHAKRVPAGRGAARSGRADLAGS
jgi:hypothetical protein